MMPSAAAKSRDYGRPCEQKGMRSKPSPSDTASLWRLFSSVTPVSFPDGTAQDPFFGKAEWPRLDFYLPVSEHIYWVKCASIWRK